MKSAGLRNKVIQNKLKEYVPIKDVIVKISKWFEKLYAIKFQGKPDKIEPLMNSTKPKIAENKKLLTMAKEKKAAMKEVESAFSKQKDFLNHKTGSK